MTLSYRLNGLPALLLARRRDPGGNVTLHVALGELPVGSRRRPGVELHVAVASGQNRTCSPARSSSNPLAKTIEGRQLGQAQ